MTDGKISGRAVGVLLLAQMAGSYLVNFTLLAPVSSAPGGLLANAAASPLRVGVWGLVGLAVAGLPLAVAVLAWKELRRGGERLALAFAALCAVGLALQVVEHAGLLSVLSLSEAQAQDPAGALGPMGAAALLARSLRNWLHFSGLVLAGVAQLLFFGALWRGRLVPRALAAIGLVAAPLQAASVALPFLGRDVIFPLLAPLGVALLLLALWLLWRGFSAAESSAAPG